MPDTDIIQAGSYTNTVSLANEKLSSGSYGIPELLSVIRLPYGVNNSQVIMVIAITTGINSFRNVHFIYLWTKKN